MKKILFLFIIFFINIGFAVEIPYKEISKNIDNEVYIFSIPDTFCEYKNPISTIFQFVKCYEIELEEEGELPFFSEVILIGFEKDDKKVQNMTDKYFAKIQKTMYQNMSLEEKELYLKNYNYLLSNKQAGFIVDNNFISYRKGANKNGNKFISYESNLFLNKRYFMINWSQYLTKNENLMKRKNFVNFIKINKKNNNKNEDIVFSHDNGNVVISIPRFDNFYNFTNKEIINISNIDAIFVNLIDNKNVKSNIKLFKVSIIHSNLNTTKMYNKIIKNDINIDSEIINYNNDEFIKIIKDDNIMYLTYANISNNLSFLISFETKANDLVAIKDIYKYKKQLVKDNKNGR